MNLIKRYPLASFVTIALSISWIIWIPLIVLGQDLLPGITGFIIIGGFGPFLSAVIVTLIADGRDGFRKWRKQVFKVRVGAKFYILVFLFPIIYAALSYSLYLLMGGTPADFSNVPPWYLYPLSLVFVFFLGGGQEEPGWRGFALPRLLSKYSPFISSIIVGVIWAVWHIPLFFVGGSSQAGLPLEWYIPNVIGMAMVFTLLYLKTNGSVIPAMVLHAGLNSAIIWFPMKSGILPSYAYITIVGWSIVVLLILIYGRKGFFRSPRNVRNNTKNDTASIRKYSYAELGMLFGMFIGSGIGITAFSFTGDAQSFTLTGIGIIFGLGIGSVLDKRQKKKRDNKMIK